MVHVAFVVASASLDSFFFFADEQRWKITCLIGNLTLSHTHNNGDGVSVWKLRLDVNWWGTAPATSTVWAAPDPLLTSGALSRPNTTRQAATTARVGQNRSPTSADSHHPGTHPSSVSARPTSRRFRVDVRPTMPQPRIRSSRSVWVTAAETANGTRRVRLFKCWSCDRVPSYRSCSTCNAKAALACDAIDGSIAAASTCSLLATWEKTRHMLLQFETTFRSILFPSFLKGDG